MKTAVLLALALLATFVAERFFDAGVVLALLFGAIGLFLKHATLLSFLMPIAAFLCINKEWRTTTILLYSAFILLALSTRRRNGLISAAIALLLLAVEIFVR